MFAKRLGVSRVIRQCKVKGSRCFKTVAVQRYININPLSARVDTQINLTIVSAVKHVNIDSLIQIQCGERQIWQVHSLKRSFICWTLLNTSHQINTQLSIRTSPCTWHAIFVIRASALLKQWDSTLRSLHDVPSMCRQVILLIRRSLISKTI